MTDPGRAGRGAGPAGEAPQIPGHHNPAGVSLSAPRRAEILGELYRERRDAMLGSLQATLPAGRDLGVTCRELLRLAAARGGPARLGG
jgi:hypothetical protein